jgi:hypothetical protein
MAFSFTAYGTASKAGTNAPGRTGGTSAWADGGFCRVANRGAPSCPPHTAVRPGCATVRRWRSGCKARRKNHPFPAGEQYGPDLKTHALNAVVTKVTTAANHRPRPPFFRHAARPDPPQVWLPRLAAGKDAPSGVSEAPPCEMIEPSGPGGPSPGGVRRKIQGRPPAPVPPIAGIGRIPPATSPPFYLDASGSWQLTFHHTPNRSRNNAK